ncbi:CLUMA_CG000626, isoform A [Clunio marinus]|uniref:CLUMA_CG000626, isoform A n=1 Tax=Clunio marinus TaxID=568069 RepID=A0A1J1HG08_9DIPT|nr:CLUMA_CG000626, isoform A [Clunio marinus]
MYWNTKLLELFEIILMSSIHAHENVMSPTDDRDVLDEHYKNEMFSSTYVHARWYFSEILSAVLSV